MYVLEVTDILWKLFAKKIPFSSYRLSGKQAARGQGGDLIKIRYIKYASLGAHFHFREAWDEVRTLASLYCYNTQELKVSNKKRVTECL